MNVDDKNIKKTQKRIPKKKVCNFCVEKALDIDYKDLAKLRKYTTEKGKIIPSRMSGVCAKHQRLLEAEPLGLKALFTAFMQHSYIQTL
jgi:small subunit ribosomal protein S18